jgi:probable phosphoglycerate mutase
VTTLLVVRHGEAEGNPEGRFIGQMDVPLTELGRQQVVKVTAALVDRRSSRPTTRPTARPITRVVSSDLQRAAETVRPTAEKLGLDIELEPRLREIANGIWAGLLATEVEAQWPELFESYKSGVDVHREGGERWQDVQLRVREAITDAAWLPDDVVLIGTHAGPAMAIARWAAGHPPVGNVFTAEFPPLANTSISTYRLAGSELAGSELAGSEQARPELIDYNDASHL